MNVLIVGLGSIAKMHISALKQIKNDVKIYALRSSGNSSNNDTENVVNLFSFEETLQFKFDFIIVSNPTSEHLNTLVRFSQLGVPFFIEKPLFDKVGDEEQKLVESITSSAEITYVACNLRFLESLVFLKNELIGKRINEVNAYCGSYLPDWRPNQNFRKVYSANKEQGGGVHIDLIHELDYLYWIFGNPRNCRSTFTNTSSLDISAFDYANYTWMYEEFNASIILNYYRRDAKRTLEVLTDECTYTVDLLKNTVSKQNNVIFESDQKIVDTYEIQLRFFMEEILTKKQIFNPIHEAYNILKLCLN